MWVLADSAPQGECVVWELVEIGVADVHLQEPAQSRMKNEMYVLRCVAAGPQTYGVLARSLALVYKNNASSYNTYTALTIVWRELGCVSGYV